MARKLSYKESFIKETFKQQDKRLGDNNNLDSYEVDKAVIRTSSSYKGQAFLIELFVISTTILLIVLFFFSTFNSINEFKANSQRTHFIVEDAASVLILSRGYPADWDINLTNTEALGLTLRRNIIDQTKLNVFNQTNVTELLGLTQYNVSINVTLNGSQIYQAGFVNTSSNVIQIERVCIYNNSPCKMRLQVSGGTQ